MSAAIEKRIQALEATAPAEDLLIIVRFIGPPFGDEREANRAEAAGVELLREPDESAEEFLARAEKLARSNLGPNCIPRILCWSDDD